jgi:hypothetical protein
MPIDYTSTTSGLFVRLGKIINVGKDWLQETDFQAGRVSNNATQEDGIGHG